MKYFFTKELKSKFQLQLQVQLQLNKLDTDKLELDIVQIGNNLSSTKYINLKKKVGQELGIEVNLFQFNQKFNQTDEDDSLETIKNNLNKKTDKKTGLIIQLPISKEFEPLLSNKEIWNNKSDVDFLTTFKRDQYLSYNILPPTIQGIDLVIREAYFNQKFELSQLIKISNRASLRGVTVGVIGQGVLVGGFMLNYLKDREATIISVNQYSKNWVNLIQNCEIIITATGKRELIKSNMISQNTKLLIDVGSSEQEGSIFGDLDYQDFENNQNNYPNLIICPSKGGVGPLTVLSLFWNLFRLNQIDL